MINSEKDRQEEIIRYCEKKGISIAAFYIIGLSGDTIESARRTLDYAKKINTLVAQFTICTPFPGTKFYEEKKNYIYEKNWEKFTSYNPVYEHENLNKKELLGLKEEAWISYYFRPSYIIKHLKKILF
jgi:anaerobic magnesium-protoporphyrin IX monomethyl ester cyclase